MSAEEMRKLEERYMRAMRAILGCFDPTQEQWEEFYAAKKELSEEQNKSIEGMV